MQTSRSSRLKRRFGITQPPESQLFAAIDASLVGSEPPHKKYKALFDESDPGGILNSGIEPSMGIGSITQPETPPTFPYAHGIPRHTQHPPPPAAEEEEESTAPPAAGSLSTDPADNPPRTNQTTRDDNADGIDMTDADEGNRPLKRRVAGVPSEQTQAEGSRTAPKSLSKVHANTQMGAAAPQASGAAPGKPDRDEAFLKAVASTKRGKKQEDPFDREFNNLRISKPDLQNEQATDDWALLGDFGDDFNLRGNFMVVVEMDIFQKNAGERSIVRTASARADWEGRLDFKKFKKVCLTCYESYIDSNAFSESCWRTPKSCRTLC